MNQTERHIYKLTREDLLTTEELVVLEAHRSMLEFMSNRNYTDRIVGIKETYSQEDVLLYARKAIGTSLEPRELKLQEMPEIDVNKIIGEVEPEEFMKKNELFRFTLEKINGFLFNSKILPDNISNHDLRRALRDLYTVVDPKLFLNC